MKTLFKLSRFVFALGLAFGALALSTSAARADGVVKNEYTSYGTFMLSGVCSFDIAIESTLQISEIDFFDASGALTRLQVHVVERDTFTANGKMLVGLPFTVNYQMLLDSNGYVTHYVGDGIVEKVLLPDGSLFVTAGRVDFTAYPNGGFVLSPDRGYAGNIAGFCAALSA